MALKLDLDLSGVSTTYASRGGKRNYHSSDDCINLKDESSLALGLGPLPTSRSSICPEKMLADNSSMDLSLSINLNRPSNSLILPTRVSNRVSERIPAVDLQLSLSPGTTESGATTITSHSEFLVFTPTLLLVDEGSTSSQWKSGPHILPKNTSTAIAATPSLDTKAPIPHIIPKTTLPTIAATPSLEAKTASIPNKPKRKVTIKPCRIEGCVRGGRGASGLCISHGGGRRCQKLGCKRGAEGKTVFCKAHGGGRRCQHLGCTKSAEGSTDYCIVHGGGRRCSHDGCTRAARGKSGLCIRHGGGKRCKIENCTRSAEGISGLCISHGGGRRCQYPQCTKGAQGSTMFCKAHGGGRRCTYLGCTKGAEGSTQFCKGHGGGKRCTAEGCTKSVHGGTLYCVSHGGGKRCAVPECTKSARGRTNHCVRHGGGKRCRSEGCPKSVQGRTDFCKAHGGGRKCSWGHPGSEFGRPGAVPCDKFARKSGLCAAHKAQVPERSTLQDPSSCTQMDGIFAPGNVNYGVISTSIPMSVDHGEISTSYVQQFGWLPMMLRNAVKEGFSLPEGRVHGGRLMSMLRGIVVGVSCITKEGGSELEVDKSVHMPHKWV